MTKFCVSTFILAVCFVTNINKSSAGPIKTNSPDFIDLFDRILAKISDDYQITLELDEILSIDQTAGQSGTDYKVLANVQSGGEIRLCKSHIEDPVATYNLKCDLRCGEVFYKTILELI